MERTTADEEQSLFPRLQPCPHQEAQVALATMACLEADHRRADALHQLVDRVGIECLDQGRLSSEKAAAFVAAVADLTSIYSKHIDLEDNLVFPLAARLLSPADKSEIGSEMAQRRQLRDPAELQVAPGTRQTR